MIAEARARAQRRAHDAAGGARRPVRKWRVARRTVLAALLLVVAGWVFTMAEIVATGNRDEARPASAIVVLGAAQYVGRPSPVLRARLDHAIGLWREGMAPRVIFTGGRGEGDTTSEAAVSRRYALRRGVPDSAIVLETRGRTTRESLSGVATIMKGQARRDVILVSDPFHMLRLSILARRFGLEPLTSPTRTSPISQNRDEAWRYVVGESFKVPVVFLLERRSQ
ncbi:MAG TPA: YdcF family protein [Gemmatimonadaceae bacterium]|nr:YdcF family protein [Gemmatimonadaceae bacterium]